MTEVEEVQFLDFGTPRVIPAHHTDAFAPVLSVMNVSEVTTEQTDAIRRVLLLSSSDTNFAQRAAEAIRIILSGGIVPPVIASVNPNQAKNDLTARKVTLLGSGFDPTCVIFVNGNEVPTTFTSDTELSTTLNLVGITPASYPVQVRTGAGVLSNLMVFTVVSATQEEPVKETVKETPPRVEESRRAVKTSHREPEHHGD